MVDRASVGLAPVSQEEAGGVGGGLVVGLAASAAAPYGVSLRPFYSMAVY